MKLYRFEDISYGVLNEWEEVAGSYVRVEEREYEIIKETPKGYWIKYFSSSREFPVNDKKWVSNNARNRFAFPSKEEALVNFEARKKRQIEILGTRLKKAKEALGFVEPLRSAIRNDIEE
jgi:hypothetical protein